MPDSSSTDPHDTGSDDTGPDDAARDELVSAYLDGEATPAEVATVEASPDLMARVEVFAALQAPLRATPTPDPTAKNAAIAAAVAAVSVDTTEVAAAAAAAVQTRATARAVPWYRRLAPGLVMACVLLAGLVAVPFLRDDSRESFSGVASAIDASEATSATDTASFEADEKQGEVAATADAASPVDQAESAGDSIAGSAPDTSAFSAAGSARIRSNTDLYAAGFDNLEALVEQVQEDLEVDLNQDEPEQAPSSTEAPPTEPLASGTQIPDTALLFFEERCAASVDIDDGYVLESRILPSQDVFVIVGGPDGEIHIIDAGSCETLLLA